MRLTSFLSAMILSTLVMNHGEITYVKTSTLLSSQKHDFADVPVSSDEDYRRWPFWGRRWSCCERRKRQILRRRRRSKRKRLKWRRRDWKHRRRRSNRRQQRHRRDSHSRRRRRWRKSDLRALKAGTGLERPDDWNKSIKNTWRWNFSSQHDEGSKQDDNKAK